MGWTDNRTGFLKIEDNKKYRLRVLLPFGCRSCNKTGYYPNYPNVKCDHCGAGSSMLIEAECLSGWYHRIPGIFNQERKLKRGYRTFLCNLDGSGRGAECKVGLCGKHDPLWGMLGERDKFRKRNNLPVETHFGLTPQHIVPVYNYDAKQIQILKFGNELRKGLARIIEAKNVLAGRDILVWRTKTDNQTNYYVEAGDPSPFEFDGALDYGPVEFKNILNFEQVTPVEAWNYVQGEPIDGTSGEALPPGQSAPALPSASGSSGSWTASMDDVTRYQRARGLTVDAGTRYIGKTVGTIIDLKDFAYLAWLVSMSPTLKEEAKWLTDLVNSGKLAGLIAASSAKNEPEPPKAEPEPPPPYINTTSAPTSVTPTPSSTDVKVTYVQPPSNVQQDTATIALVATANDMMEKKFAGKPDEEVINHLAGVYGPYKSVVELDISKWNKEKLTNLIASLVK